MYAAADLLERTQAPSTGLRRHFDARRLNELANHPEIRPTCGGDGKSPLDFSAFVADRKNYAMVWDHGAFLFYWSAPQTYEVHIMVEPEGRGLAAYAKAAEGIVYMVSQGMERLWARVSDNGPRHYTTQAGFTKCGTDTLDIGFGPVTYDLYHWKKPCLQQS